MADETWQVPDIIIFLMLSKNVLQASVDCSGDPHNVRDLRGPFTFYNLSSYGIVPGTVCSVTGCFFTEGEDRVLTMPAKCTLQGKHTQSFSVLLYKM